MSDMPLHTGFTRTTTRDERVPYLRYDALGPIAGQFSDATDVGIPFLCQADFEWILTGWGLLEKGLPPEWTWDPAIDRPAPRPGKGHRRAFSLRLFFPNGRGLRELTSANQGLFAAFAKIYDAEFELAPERAAGLVPLVEQTDFVSSETPFGQVIDPVFGIVRWEPRPPELAPRPRPAASAPAAAKPSLPSLAGDRDGLDDDIPF
jgi:hypothetical protein